MARTRTPRQQFRFSGIISTVCLIAAVLIIIYIARTTGWFPKGH